MNRNSTKNQIEKKSNDVWVSLGAIAFGLYFLIGAYVGASHAEWPIFMPPQIDLFGLLFSVFGKPLGAYLGAMFLAVLGMGCVWLGIVVFWKASKA